MLRSIKNIRKLKKLYIPLISHQPCLWCLHPFRKRITNWKGRNQFWLYFILLTFVSCKFSQPAPSKGADSTLPYYSSPAFTPHWKSIDRDSGYFNHHISPFTVVNQLGDTITEKILQGKIYVAGFFFTACPGICRNLTLQLKKSAGRFSRG